MYTMDWNGVLKIMDVTLVPFVYLVTLSIVVATGPTVNSETHSLTYICSALSKPVGLPGIHQFSAMGLLDGRMIDYFDSEHQQKVPKQDWMKERLDPDYWVKGTWSHLDDQKWFKVSLNTLMKQMGHKDSDLHVLQWMRGCEGNMQPDGSITFHHGKNIYAYDGNDFLSFDETNKVWVAATEAAKETKEEWNYRVRTDYRLYLENECMESLRKFVDYQRLHLQIAPPPEVFMFSKDTNNDKKVMLTCLATGFYPKDVTLNIKRNGRVLTKEDGVVTSGVRPNDDDTFQRRDSVEILRRDTSTFTCEVNHPASRLHVEKKWDHKLPPGPEGLGLIIGVFVGLQLLMLVAVCVLLTVFYKKGKSAKSMGGANTFYAAGNGGAKKAEGPDAVDPKGSRRSLSVSDCGVFSAQPLSVITAHDAVNRRAKKAEETDPDVTVVLKGSRRSLSVSDCVSRSHGSLSIDDSGVFRNSTDNKNSSPESQSLLGQNEEPQV